MPRIGHTLVLAKVMGHDAILSVSLVSAVSVPVAAKKSRPEGPFPLRHHGLGGTNNRSHTWSQPAWGDPLGRVTGTRGCGECTLGTRRIAVHLLPKTVARAEENREQPETPEEFARLTPTVPSMPV